jgi:hypothetical protein
VWYRAGVGEDLEIRRMRGRASEAERTGASLAEVLRLHWRLAARVIEAWDLRNDDGQPVPVTAGALQPLPLGALQRMVSEATGRRGREGQSSGGEQDDPDICVSCRSGVHDICSGYGRAPGERPCACPDGAHGEESER